MSLSNPSNILDDLEDAVAESEGSLSELNPEVDMTWEQADFDFTDGGIADYD